MEMHEHERRSGLYIFFDEIQYHPDWERHLKSLVDSFPSMRFVVSGSAAAALKLKSQESGAGRFTEFLLPPLTFAEFVKFSGHEDEVAEAKSPEDRVAVLNGAFIDYLNYGGFPEAVMVQAVRQEMDRFVANDILDKVLLRDLPSLYGVQDTQELKRFFTTIAYNTGMEVSYEGLSKSSGVAKNTVRKYLEYLEAAFLIHRHYRIDQNARRFKRVTHFKVYLVNASIRAALFGPVDADSEAMGRLAETAFLGQLASTTGADFLFYARWKDGEVDVVFLDAEQRILGAHEIKWSDRCFRRPAEELRGIMDFASANGLGEAVVHTRTVSGQKTENGIKLTFGPIADTCYHFSSQIFGVAGQFEINLDSFRDFMRHRMN
jgi:predicted AAA+ superfamily ATPase